MPDNQWYNAPQNNGRKKGKPVNSNRQPSGKKVRSNGAAPVKGGQRPAGTPQGAPRPVNGNAPVNGQNRPGTANGKNRPVNGANQANKKGQGYPGSRTERSQRAPERSRTAGRSAEAFR